MDLFGCRQSYRGKIMKHALLIGFGAVALAFTSGCCTQSRRAVWEYRVVQGSAVNRGLEQQLNVAGKEGFVIDSAVAMPLPPSQPTAIPEAMVILKRPGR